MHGQLPDAFSVTECYRECFRFSIKVSRPELINEHFAQRILAGKYFHQCIADRERLSQSVVSAT